MSHFEKPMLKTLECSDEYELEWILMNKYNFGIIQPFTDIDYRIADGVYMVYSTSYGAGYPNATAIRILLDHFMLELPQTSDDIDIYQYCPKGVVVFYIPEHRHDNREHLKLYVRNIWSSLFSDNMPYTSLYKRIGSDPNIHNKAQLIRSRLFDLYRTLPVASLEQITKLDLQYSIPVHCMTCGVIDRVCSTIIGAIFYSYAFGDAFSTIIQ